MLGFCNKKLRRYSFFLIGLILITTIFSCKNEPKVHIDSFKHGNFKTVLEDNDVTSTAYRNDSLQIETYQNEKDTFYITWKNDFEYILVKKNPKSLLDSTPFRVKITGIKGNTYHFRANYKGSKFTQEGTAIKIE